MATFREWVMRLWGTIRPGRRDADVGEELRLHLELAAEHERRATSPQAAARAAVIRFGGLAQSMEAVRDQRACPGSPIWLAICATGFARCAGIRCSPRSRY